MVVRWLALLAFALVASGCTHGSSDSGPTSPPSYHRVQARVPAVSPPAGRHSSPHQRRARPCWRHKWDEGVHKRNPQVMLPKGVLLATGYWALRRGNAQLFIDVGSRWPKGWDVHPRPGRVGLVIIERFSRCAHLLAVRRYPIDGTGPLRIRRAVGSELQLRSADGSTITFDLRSRTFH